MKPSKTDTLKLLRKLDTKSSHHSWLTHVLCVGDSAGKIAATLNQRGHNLDVEKITVLGYLHDIGRVVDNNSLLGHVISGYAYLKRQGYTAEYCNICLTHSFIKNDVNFTLGSSIFAPDQMPEPSKLQSFGDVVPNSDVVQFLTDFIANHQFGFEEKLVSLCDLMCRFEPMTLEARIVDVISRHGVNKNTQAYIQAAMQLKQEFDKLLDKDVYQVISS